MAIAGASRCDHALDHDFAIMVDNDIVDNIDLSRARLGLLIARGPMRLGTALTNSSGEAFGSMA